MLVGCACSLLERLAQFQTDVAAIEQLSHPNIARVYGLQQAAGETILVMELVEGPTLADRLTQGPIPLDETVVIATGIIDALEAAHAAGVTHRDLTPNNVKIKADGTITVLDFGLIKAGVGIVMGAAAYVSPERARGQPTDKCSDIWSFGVILFEMLSGQRPFTGRTESEILTSVLKTDPNWALLRSDVPWPVGQVLRRCLDKDTDRRLPELVFVRLELQDARPTPPPLQGELAEPAAPTRWSLRRVVLGGVILGSLIAGLAVWPACALPCRLTPQRPRRRCSRPTTNTRPRLQLDPAHRCPLYGRMTRQPLCLVPRRRSRRAMVRSRAPRRRPQKRSAPSH